MNGTLFVILAALGLMAFGLSKKAASSSTSPVEEDSSLVYRSNPWNLPDVDSSNQGGGYDRTYDESFEKAAGETQVPFALIKAHAIRESSLKPTAYHFDNATVGASYGLMQCEWIAGSDRFAKYGFPDAVLGSDGSALYTPDTSALIGAYIIRDNLNWLKGNVRDAINAYNTGHAESGGAAPAHYTDDVIGYYNKILGENLV